MSVDGLLLSWWIRPQKPAGLIHPTIWFLSLLRRPRRNVNGQWQQSSFDELGVIASLRETISWRADESAVARRAAKLSASRGSARARSRSRRHRPPPGG